MGFQNRFHGTKNNLKNNAGFKIYDKIATKVQEFLIYHNELFYMKISIYYKKCSDLKN